MLTDNSPMVRVSKRHPCPVCSRPTWCGYSPDGRLAVCMRVSEGAKKRTRNGGYLHVLRDDPGWRGRPRVRVVALSTRGSSPANFGRLAASYEASVDMAELRDFAGDLGLSAEGPIRLGVGWAAKRRAWSFPMHDPDRRVRGIRLRSWAGRKWAVQGGREGLFYPTGLDFAEPLLICEGPTDTAALLDLGFEAVGRPSCAGGTNLLIELVRSKRPPGVVIFADGDGPGRRGAEALAAALLPVCRSVRLICPPEGVKDARAWKQAGAIRQDVLAVMDAAPTRSLQVQRRSTR